MRKILMIITVFISGSLVAVMDDKSEDWTWIYCKNFAVKFTLFLIMGNLNIF